MSYSAGAEGLVNMINEFSTKRLQDKTRLGGKGDWAGTVQESEFLYTTEWYMRKPESVWENETHKILKHQLTKQKKRTCCFTDFAASANYCEKIRESERKDKYLDLAREFKKKVEREDQGNTSYNWSARNSPKEPCEGTGGTRNQ